ncbi:hypothetical protein E3E23_01680 [Thermococcus sp. CX2]|uniref:hypothetical protein n=1 Tax=Thermococcus sp. CX2 TaxID=163006 RepID=UPI00143C902D|nr:hypothetical protein [Thermococcus sp. CX2]NJE84555.1 hypothetical protein [Thermococcus sp. CX2]
MKKILALIIVLFIGSVLGTAYALVEPPSKDTLVTSARTLVAYNFTRSIEFNQYYVHVIEQNGVRKVMKDFTYIGKVITVGHIDMRKEIVKAMEEFYVNGTLLTRAQVIVNLNTGEIKGTIMLNNGTTMDLTEFWSQYYGIEKDEAITMFEDNLPMIAFRRLVLNSTGLSRIQLQLSTTDRILMGLGLKERLFAYRFTSPSGKEWTVLVNSRGIPVRFESQDKDLKVTVVVQPSE